MGLPRFFGPGSLPILRTFWEVDFEIEIFFGQTTLCAGVIWQEDVRFPCLSRRLSSLTLFFVLLPHDQGQTRKVRFS